MKYTTIDNLDDLKGIIRSISTTTASPEQVLDRLDELGMEPFLTKEGDLMIKYWQVGAENFVSPEQAAVIRDKRPTPNNSDSMEWLSTNLEKVRREFSNQWIAIKNNNVVSSAPTLPQLMSQITDYEAPFVTFISAESIVWNFAYAR
jgi:superfamily II helicase